MNRLERANVVPVSGPACPEVQQWTEFDPVSQSGQQFRDVCNGAFHMQASEKPHSTPDKPFVYSVSGGHLRPQR